MRKIRREKSVVENDTFITFQFTYFIVPLDVYPRVSFRYISVT